MGLTQKTIKNSQQNTILNSKNLKRKIIALIVHIVLWIIFFIMFAYTGFENSQPYLVISFLFNGILFYCMMVFSLRKRAFSLDLIHAFFLFTFMFFAPFIQYLKGAWCWGTSFSDYRILTTNLMLDCWVLVYIATKRWKRPRGTAKKLSALKKNTKEEFARVRVNFKFLAACVIVSDVIALYMFAKYGTSLFSRGTNNAYNFANSSLSLIVSSVVPAFITGTTAFAVMNLQPRGRLIDWFLLLLQAFAQLIVCFPMGMARFQMAVVYIGLALVCFPFFRKGNWFLLMMTFGLIIIFPLLNAFRRVAFSEVNILEVLIRIPTSLLDDLLDGHYDAYTMFMLTQEYVAEYHLSYGMQLLGVILFWVPRSFWPGKPVGSGQTAAEFFGWDFTNLSCPLPAEGFVNFGFIGVLLFAFLLSGITQRLDDRFWKGRDATVKVIYPFLLPFLFFMMRGDLLSSFAYMFGFAVTILFIYFLNEFFNKKEKKYKSRRKRRRKKFVSAKRESGSLQTE